MFWRLGTRPSSTLSPGQENFPDKRDNMLIAASKVDILTISPGNGKVMDFAANRSALTPFHVHSSSLQHPPGRLSLLDLPPPTTRPISLNNRHSCSPTTHKSDIGRIHYRVQTILATSPLYRRVEDTTWRSRHQHCWFIR